MLHIFLIYMILIYFKPIIEVNPKILDKKFNKEGSFYGKILKRIQIKSC